MSSSVDQWPIIPNTSQNPVRLMLERYLALKVSALDLCIKSTLSTVASAWTRLLLVYTGRGKNSKEYNIVLASSTAISRWDGGRDWSVVHKTVMA